MVLIINRTKIDYLVLFLSYKLTVSYYFGYIASQMNVLVLVGVDTKRRLLKNDEITELLIYKMAIIKMAKLQNGDCYNMEKLYKK